MKWVAPPPTLLAAFKAAETVEGVGAMLVDDGFDALTLRVLSAWENTEHRWSKPKKPCPDDGRPTSAAWSWLCSTWAVDYGAIAEGAGVSRDVARERVAVLLHARLIYPDGQIAKAARTARTAAIRARLKSEQARQGDKKPPVPPATPAAN